MDDNNNPALNPIFEGRDLTRLSISTAQPAQPKRKSVPPAIGKIVGELGFRYRPAAAADLEAHGHALRLLSEDLADVPPHLLEDACKRWVRDNKFMPKASELVALARETVTESVRGSDFGLQELEGHCSRLNALSWVRQSGKFYVIGQRTVEGAQVRFVDRAA